MENLIVTLQNFLLVSLRAGCLLIFCPPWDSRFIPVPVRVLSILGLAVVLTPVVTPFLPSFPASWSAGVFLVVREFVLGLGFGLVFRFLFAGVQMAGNLVGIQMGFGMATLIDPQSQANNNILAEILVLMATLIFLTMDGHHALLRLLTRSFQDVPLKTAFSLPGSLLDSVADLGRLMYRLSIQLLAPVLTILFLTQLALGLVARAVPKIQVMIVGFPLTIALGLFFISITLMVAGPALMDQFAALKGPLEQALMAWKE
jgi:flagellar biosynthetic protein FliR